MFDVFYYGPKPGLFEFERPADSLEHAAAQCRTGYYWYIYGGNDYTEFDFNYSPVPWESQYTHVWPSQWCEYGGTYLAHTDTVSQNSWHFHKQVVQSLPSTDNWRVIVDAEFDFSWRPHPFDPPFIYVFGNQWYPAERMATVEYHAPGATERKYMDLVHATLISTTENWVTTSDVPVDFDYSWCPDPHDPPFIYVFGNQHWSGERSATVEYHVPGATERKFISDISAKLSTLDIFFVDKSNATAQVRWERVKARYPHAQKLRYANSMTDTIERCVTRTNTPRFWVISSEYDYTDFDFDWQPEPWQHQMTHVFSSQHQKWSDTFLINKWEFQRHVLWAGSLEKFPNLNFVNNQTVTKPENLHNIYYVDHGNGNIARHQYEHLRLEYPDMVITRFVGNYLDTFKRIMATAETEYVWIINSICDYSQFDFTWQPEPWQAEMIHVFRSDHTKEGDTFYIHVESFRQQMYELDILDFFNVINYCEDQSVLRFGCPIHFYTGDDLVAEIQNYKFETPYVFFTQDRDRYSKGILRTIAPTYVMWSEKDRAVLKYNGSGSSALVPRDIKSHLKTQIYDYPYISKRHIGMTDDPLDIVFISNGEPDEQRMFDHTEYMCNRTVKWCVGVQGRTAAYQAAARLSSTPWFFMVFAKLSVLGGGFDWDWQPDYFQQPKHYIFNAKNPVNGLEYGHMGMIAYNKNLVLANNNPGLDFTLSQPHESVPVLSGTAHFNQDAWMTWRTAFREVLKLKHFMNTSPTVETEHRLNTWLTVAQGNHAEYCLAGAADAVEYYAEVAGDYELLKLSFDWAWLQTRFNASKPV
jgi:hypothetical protein